MEKEWLIWTRAHKILPDFLAQEYSGYVNTPLLILTAR